MTTRQKQALVNSVAKEIAKTDVLPWSVYPNLAKEVAAVAVEQAMAKLDKAA